MCCTRKVMEVKLLYVYAGHEGYELTCMIFVFIYFLVHIVLNARVQISLKLGFKHFYTLGPILVEWLL